METLPIELVYKIQSYIYRRDWKTCKRDEAMLIKSYRLNVDEAIVAIDYISQAIDDDWTLYGKHWLLQTDESNLFAHRRPRCPPPPMENYNTWYKLRIQWLLG